MKKLSIVFLSVIALGVTITSFNTYDSAAAPSIKGRWHFATYRTLDSKGQPIMGPFTTIDGLIGKNDRSCRPLTKEDALTFNDIALTPTNGVYTDYPTSGCDSPKELPFKYSRTGNHLVITGLPVSMGFDIVSSTSKQLTLNLNGTKAGNIQLYLYKD